MLRFLGIGDNVCDIYLHSGNMYPGGQALNFAVYAKQLGIPSAYMGVFGQDEISRHITHTLDLLGVEYARSRQYQGENGYAVVNLVDGDRVFVGSNRGGVAKDKPIVIEDADKEYICGFDLVHTSNNSYFDSQLEAVHSLNVTISYDFSCRWNDWERTAGICPYIDFGFLSCGSMSEKEIQNVCEKVHHLGCEVVVATMGRKGALLYDGEFILHQPAENSEAVDTLGAGDSFATGFLVFYTNEKKENNDRVVNKDKKYREEAYKGALKAGSLFAAKNCMVKGAFGYGTKIPEAVLRKLESLYESR